VKVGAGEVGSTVQQQAVDLRDSAAHEARTVVHDARDQAATVVQSARQTLRTQADEQAKSLAGTLHDIAQQLSKMADAADDQQSGVATAVRQLSDQADRSAGRLEVEGVDGLLSDLSRTARTRPGLFLLGSAAAGFAVGRLVRHLDVGELTEAAREQSGGNGQTDANVSTSGGSREVSPFAGSPSSGAGGGAELTTSASGGQGASSGGPASMGGGTGAPAQRLPS
jgi:hypothetical protein